MCDIETSNQMDHNDAFDPIESKLDHNADTHINIRILTSSNSWCDFCFIKYDNITKRDKHLLSSSHLKKLANKRIIISDHIIDYCAYCLTIPSGTKQLDFHLQSLGHFKQKLRFKSCVRNKYFDNFIKFDNKFEKVHLENCRINEFYRESNNFSDSNRIRSIDQPKNNIDETYFSNHPDHIGSFFPLY